MTGSTTDEQGAFRCPRTGNPQLISIVALVQLGSSSAMAHQGQRADRRRDDGPRRTLLPERRFSAPGMATILDVPESAQDQHHVVTETLGVAGAGHLRIDVERCGLESSFRKGTQHCTCQQGVVRGCRCNVLVCGLMPAGSTRAARKYLPDYRRTRRHSGVPRGSSADSNETQYPGTAGCGY